MWLLQASLRYLVRGFTSGILVHSGFCLSTSSNICDLAVARTWATRRGLPPA